MDVTRAKSLIGRTGRIQRTDREWYSARVVDYNVKTKQHKVVWLGEWNTSELCLGKKTVFALGVHCLWLDNLSPRSSFLGKFILLKPNSNRVLYRYVNQCGPIDDNRACVVAHAEDEEGYYVYYLAHNLIVTVDLKKVKFEILDPTTNESLELHNSTAPYVELGPPADVDNLAVEL